jgi:hypothetical protein
MAAPKTSRSAPRPGGQAATTVLEGSGGGGESLCTCCDPRNPLVMRPDLGTLADGTPEYALCVLHDPEPVVYRNRGDGSYVEMPRLKLSPSGEILGPDGQPIARVAGDSYQRLSTIDDDDPHPDQGGGGGATATGADRASRPQTIHVDLTKDDFYHGTARDLLSER